MVLDPNCFAGTSKQHNFKLITLIKLRTAVICLNFDVQMSVDNLQTHEKNDVS